jgi:hypothetical protein
MLGARCRAGRRVAPGFVVVVVVVAGLLGGCDLGRPATSYDIPGHQLAAGDVNGDGNLDLVVGDISILGVGVASGDGGGGFAPVTMPVSGSFPGPPGGPVDPQLVDVNGDGFDDVLFAKHGENPADDDFTVWRLLNDGAGGFGQIEAVTAVLLVGDEGAAASSWGSGDIDGDGVADVVVVNSLTGVASAALGDGAGGFGPSTTSALPEVLFSGYEVTLVDLDGDGRDDLVGSGSDVVVSEQRFDGFFVVAASDGSGGFPSAQKIPSVDLPAGESLGGPYTGDVDGDGDADVFAANNDRDGPTGTISLLENDGLGGLGPATETALPRPPQDIGTGDFDSDGHLDLFVSGLGNDSSVAFGDGTGAFPAHRFVAASGRVHVADLDGDGRPDVVLRSPGKLTVLLNGWTQRPGSGQIAATSGGRGDHSEK